MNQGLTPQSVPTEIALLLLILGLLIFMWDLFDRRSRSLNKSSGLAEKTSLISIKGSTSLPPREFISEKLRLKSKPDALSLEKGFLIPIDVKPSSKKIRDRHKIKMFMHMKLIEEVEGKKPPYGIILLGKGQVEMRIENSNDKQIWLDAILSEMRSIAGGIPAAPTPRKTKCKQCDVAEFCKHNAA